MRRSTFWLLLAGGIAFVVFLVVLLPARLVYAWTAPPDVRAYFVDGTILDGTAEQLEVAGFQFGRAHWSFRPASLLLGRIAFALRAERSDGFLEADVAVGFGDRVWISDVDATLPLSIGEALVPIQGVRGDVGLDFDLIRLHEAWPDRLAGTLNLVNLLVTQPSTQRMGSYRVVFDDNANGAAGALTGVFRDTSGPLDVQGTVVLKDDRSYVVEGRVLARESAPGPFNDTLQFMFGSPGPDGRRSFSFGGTL
ncbi:MAG: type II secretion system protein N [Gammaproteobacteria bacterium]